MKTNTLLAAAAILAVGGLAAQAQVYSQNVVGYYNVTVPAGKFALVANQLQNADGTNGISDVFSGGLASQTSLLYLWNGSTFVPYTYYSAADAAPSPAGFYDGNGNPAANTLNPAQGAFLFNGEASPITVTVVGTVIQGATTNYVTQGFAPYGIVQPISTNLDSSLVRFPAVSQSTDYYHWNGAGYDAALTYYSAADAAPSPAGWYDGNGNPQSSNPAYWPTVGQGFFINLYSGGGSLTWTNTFTVQ